MKQKLERMDTDSVTNEKLLLGLDDDIKAGRVTQKEVGKQI